MQSIRVEVTPQLIEKVASVIRENCAGVTELLAGFIAEDVLEYLVVRSISENGPADQAIDDSPARWRNNKVSESRAGMPMLLADILANRRDSA